MTTPAHATEIERAQPRQWQQWATDVRHHLDTLDTTRLSSTAGAHTATVLAASTTARITMLLDAIPGPPWLDGAWVAAVTSRATAASITGHLRDLYRLLETPDGDRRADRLAATIPTQEQARTLELPARTGSDMDHLAAQVTCTDLARYSALTTAAAGDSEPCIIARITLTPAGEAAIHVATPATTHTSAPAPLTQASTTLTRALADHAERCLPDGEDARSRMLDVAERVVADHRWWLTADADAPIVLDLARTLATHSGKQVTLTFEPDGRWAVTHAGQATSGALIADLIREMHRQCTRWPHI